MTSARQSGKPLRLLFVEDHASTREVFAYAFRTNGYDVVTASDVTKALAIFDAPGDQGFDIVVTDHALGQSTGLDLISALRDRNYAGKVISHSGALDQSLVEKYRGAGVVGIVNKRDGLPALLRNLQEIGRDLVE